MRKHGVCPLAPETKTGRFLIAANAPGETPTRSADLSIRVGNRGVNRGRDRCPPFAVSGEAQVPRGYFFSSSSFACTFA